MKLQDKLKLIESSDAPYHEKIKDLFEYYEIHFFDELILLSRLSESPKCEVEYLYHSIISSIKYLTSPNGILKFALTFHLHNMAQRNNLTEGIYHPTREDISYEVISFERLLATIKNSNVSIIGYMANFSNRDLILSLSRKQCSIVISRKNFYNYPDRKVLKSLYKLIPSHNPPAVTYTDNAPHLTSFLIIGKELFIFSENGEILKTSDFKTLKFFQGTFITFKDSSETIFT